MPALTGLLTIMEKAARKAGGKLRRDFGEIEHLQVSQKGPAARCLGLKEPFVQVLDGTCALKRLGPRSRTSGTSVEDHCTVKCGGKLIWEQTLESLKAC
jgi:hypothetical protein